MTIRKLMIVIEWKNSKTYDNTPEPKASMSEVFHLQTHLKEHLMQPHYTSVNSIHWQCHHPVCHHPNWWKFKCLVQQKQLLISTHKKIQQKKIKTLRGHTSSSKLSAPWNRDTWNRGFRSCLKIHICRRQDR